MSKDLEGLHLLLTGSYGNLGRSIAELAARRGAHLYLQGRNWEGERLVWANSLQAASVTLLTADLADPEQIKLMSEELHRHTKSIDILINNAGLQDIAELRELSLETWNRMISVNLTAAHLLTQMMAHDAERERSVVNILSIEAEHPAAGHSHYAAAKGGLLQYTRAAALELGPLGIRVNAVSPGLISREGLEEQWPEGVSRYTEAAPLGRLVTPYEAAEAVLFLAGPHASAVTGVNLPVDAGIGAVTGY